MTLGRTLGFIGAGNMAEALIQGLIATGASKPQEIIASDARLDHLEALGHKHGIRTGDNLAVVKASDVVILSVKPQVMDQVLVEIGAAVTEEKLVVSIAAGVPIAAMARRLNPSAHIIRTMPNTPALVGAGMTALSGGVNVTANDLKIAGQIFNAVGKSVVVDEAQLDAVTGLSGSGPAYVFLIIEALTDGGAKAGLPRGQALALAVQTVFGAAKLLIETGESPEVLRTRVTSPNGTTLAGLKALEAAGLPAALVGGVEAATNRSKELGAEFLKKLT